MKFCRFEFEGSALFGRIELRSTSAWIEEILTESPLPRIALDSESAHIASLYYAEASRAAERFSPLPLDEAALLVPARPSKILCVGRNYADHAKELGNELPKQPLIFTKPLSSLLPHRAAIRRPRISERVDFEGELTLILAKRLRNFSASTDDWRSAIFGATLANDVTARDLQKPDGQWTRAKGFDTFCPLGPWISDELDLSRSHTLITRVNGEEKQHGETRDFIFQIPALLEYISSFLTLEPGDLLLTGTPAGVGPLVAGDRVEVSLPGLGTLSNPVLDE